MQISEISEKKLAESCKNYSFELISAAFPCEDAKILKEPLFKWYFLSNFCRKAYKFTKKPRGFAETLKFLSFRSNLQFSKDLQWPEFLEKLFTSSEKSWLFCSAGSKILFEKLSISLTNLDIFDRFEEKGLIFCEFFLKFA